MFISKYAHNNFGVIWPLCEQRTPARTATHVQRQQQTVTDARVAHLKISQMGFMFSKDSTADEVELESRVRDDVPSINDVLRFIGLGRFHYFLLVACHVVLFLGFQEIMDIAFTIPHVECDIEVPEHIGRFARGASFFGALAMSLPWGFLVDTWGRVNVLRISLPIMCVSNVMCGLTVNSSSLALSRFFLGVG